VVSESTEKAPSLGRRRGARVEPYLFLVLEGARVAAGGMRVALSGLDALQLGRGEARALARPAKGSAVLLVPDARMSGAHARLVRQDASFCLEDAGSTNGTRVNGEPVDAAVVGDAPVTPRPLQDGDVLELGQTVFVYRELEDDSPVRGRDLDPSIDAQLPGLLTLDPALARRFERVAKLAPSMLSVLVLGETGTGKEVLARAIHGLSRRPGPFVAVNCGAIPANLVEAHLFGHVRGAFSGAVKDEPGMVRAAHNGTLLLDEVGDLPASSQAALLRVLQEGEVQPVGSAQTAKVDVRIVAATHMPIDELVERGAFRRDLYARLAGYTFALPPLRDRRVDLGLLIAALVASGKVEAPADLRMAPEVVRALVRHAWPMNIRELEQCLRAAFVLAEDGLVTVEDLPGAVAASLAEEEPAAEGEGDARDEELRRELLVRLVDTKGNVTEVARAMGKARQQVQRWLRRFAIDPEAYRAK
jgi:transcriptional regulator with PAS, ATPase and Fis domain